VFVVSHQGLGPEAHSALTEAVMRAAPDLPDTAHRKLVMELAKVVAPLVADAYIHENRLLKQHADARRLEDERQEERVRVLREALRWYEHLEGPGGRATLALHATRWQPPAQEPRMNRRRR
jgi:hypothetical protein